MIINKAQNVYWKLTLQDLLGYTPFFVWVGLALLLDIPDHDGLISWAWNEELFSLVTLLDFSDLHACNPTVVAYLNKFRMGQNTLIYIVPFM